jgi:EAL domain-containing protein (putative c-di-GMP-specific phosphodiesterase class I)
VLLPQVEDAESAAIIANKLITATAQPHLIDGHRLHVTLSIGISLYPDNSTNAEETVRNADIAMYHAKRNGRNNYQAYTPDMNVRAVARQSVEAALRRALEQHLFVLHYQPEVNLDTGAITGAEALLRMRRSDKRLIFPEQFVGVAEDSGLILPIDHWVLREACRQTQSWRRDGLDLAQISVNVSAREFQGRDYLTGIGDILEDTGLDPRHLELEMTESGLIRDAEPTTAVLHALKGLGVQIAIDDFGTGYSSLSYLRRFPIDTLKIDRMFVQDTESDAGEAIVSAVIAMGMSLNKRVVAEGVETQKQIDFLRSRRCVEGQGNFFSRPLAAEKFAALLAKNRRA